MEDNNEKIGLLLMSAGLIIVIASVTYMLFKLHWVLCSMAGGFLLICMGGITIEIGNKTEDNEEEEEQQ